MILGHVSRNRGAAVLHRLCDGVDKEICEDSLVFFCFLLNVADLLGDGLKGVFVVRVLHLQL